MQRVKGTLWLLGILCVPVGVAAQTETEVELSEAEEVEAEEEGSPWSADIELNQDAFFGFYPFLAAGYSLSDLLDFTFYSIIWTTPSFGIGGGTGLWTEVGAGVSLNLAGGAISVNPQVGVLNGALLSGGDQAKAAEGIVPNITVDYDGDHAEAEFYFGYYLALRGASQAKSDFIHYWAYGGLKPLGFTGGPAAGLLTVGMHWEQLRYQRVPAEGEAHNLYRWIGPYVKLELPHGVSLRFAAGANLDDDTTPLDFYKATVGFSF